MHHASPCRERLLKERIKLPKNRYCKRGGNTLSLQPKIEKMNCLKHIIKTLLWLWVSTTTAQVKFSGKVTDGATGEPLPGAVIVSTTRASRGVSADQNGMFQIERDATWGDSVAVSFVGYETRRFALGTAGGSVDFQLKEQSTRLRNVVVTATESHSMTSSSVIQKKAMEHLQPSSFADVLELVPGGMAHDPVLTTPNRIALREAGISSSNYNTSSLGTSFLIDGAPISTNANMQFMNGAWDSQTTSRDMTNAGVDMRTIPTDDVESIEIVRGIPSAEYGDLTSGLIKIKRKKGGNDIRARFKADMESKLFYVSKGVEWSKKKWTLNLSADWLDAKADPRNLLETYQRLTFSARAGHSFTRRNMDYRFDLNLDYTGSFDDDKIDPELNYGGVDRYESDYHRWAASFTMNADNRKPGAWWKGWDATLSLSYEKNTLFRQRLVQADIMTPAATTQREGESEALFISPVKYTGQHTVDGRPLSAFAKIQTVWHFPVNKVNALNRLKAGVNWQMDKNWGDGQIFDPLHPLYTGISARQRKYSDVPAENQLSEYIEEDFNYPFGLHRLSIEAGLRGSMMPGLNSKYALAGKYYLDPRVNVGWHFAPFKWADQNVNILLSASWGVHTKFPTIDQLYPELLYIDMTEFSYYHVNPNYRTLWLMTYVKDPTNHDLRAARNHKYELHTDWSWNGYRLTVTLFREDMKSGFRQMAEYSPYIYKRYDTSVIDGTTLTSKPVPADLPYEEVTALRGLYSTENGSRTLKKGVEYTFSTRRWKTINTRLTVTGAWFKTEYENSRDVQEKTSQRVGGKELELVGFYSDNEGYLREMWNTNFTFDTDIPRLDLGFSLSAQCMWQTASQNRSKSKYPTRYMDETGTIRAWQDSYATEVPLMYLVRNYNNSLEERQTVPFYMNLNLKATKSLFDRHLMIALFVNKLIDAHPDYTRNNYTIRRYVTPYFGLEINLKL